MADMQSFLKKGIPALYPHEITVADQEENPLFDDRLEKDNVGEEFIRNLVVVRQIEPVVVRIEEDEAHLADGRRRWKAATIINHLSGAHVYHGKLASIRSVIDRLKGSELEKLIVDRIGAAGMKLTIAVRRGTVDDAVSAMVSANEQRVDDDLQAKIARAHRLRDLNHDAETVGLLMGREPQTIRRWWKRDPSAVTGGKKKPTRTDRPTPARCAEIGEKLGDSYAGIGIIFKWFAGQATKREVLAAFPNLEGALEKPKKKAKAHAAA